MTGIEKLRMLAEIHRGNGSVFMANYLSGIADKIEDELEDEQGRDVETVRHDACEAWEWVRAHGGLDAVRRRWECLSYYADPVPRSCMEKRLARLQRQIDESHAALRRRNVRIEELGRRVGDLTRENAELRRRAMPEGMEWPTVDGRKVDFKTSYQPNLGVLEAVSIYNNGAVEVMSHDWIIKPVSEIHAVVPAADGEPLEVGQTVWDVNNGMEFTVSRLPKPGEYQAVEVRYRNGSSTSFDHDQLTHQRPVLDADGVEIREGDVLYRKSDGRMVEVAEVYEKTFIDADDYVRPGDGFTHRAPVFAADGRPLEVGQTVWDTDGEADTPLTVVEVSSDLVRCEYTWKDGKTYRPCYPPSALTHAKPEPSDSLERIADEIDRLREDVALHLGDYLYDSDGNDSIQFSMELVAKRCRALAERERGE